MNICVIGMGYIGLPTAAVLAEKGNSVHGVDINEKAVNLINSGEPHIYEPDLDIVVKKNVLNGRLFASLKPAKADVYIIAVPTPFAENHKPDLTYVKQAVKNIAPYLENGNQLILESTSPVGTTSQISEWVLEERDDLKIDDTEGSLYIAYCPERVLPGKILTELITNDRIVGGINDISTKKIAEFYSTFVEGEVLKTKANTAEMSKLTENSFRDVNIAFANELSVICDGLDIDVWELIELANHHPRVNILQPGPGVGGHCIAVDPWFIVDSDPENSKIIKTARNINDNKPNHVLSKVDKYIQRIPDAKVACLGLSFKANIDDLRESPALGIANKLASRYNNELLLVEPNISELPESLKGTNATLSSLNAALNQADILLVLVDHDEFRFIEKEMLENKIVIDTKGIFRYEKNQELKKGTEKKVLH